MSELPPPVLGVMTPEQLSAELGVSTRTLTTWRTKGGGPDFFRIGASSSASVRYLESDVRAWLAEKVTAERVSKPSWEAFVRNTLTSSDSDVCARLLLWVWDAYMQRTGLKYEPGMPKYDIDIRPAINQIIPAGGGYGYSYGVTTIGGIRFSEGLDSIIPPEKSQEFLITHVTKVARDCTSTDHFPTEEDVVADVMARYEPMMVH